VAVVTVLVLAYGTAVAWCFRSELHRLPAAIRRRRGGLPWRLAWRRWRLRKAPVPADGAPLDEIDMGRWAMVLKGYGDKAELEAEALMGDTEAGS
jgi:hypothetical protein